MMVRPHRGRDGSAVAGHGGCAVEGTESGVEIKYNKVPVKTGGRNTLNKVYGVSRQTYFLGGLLKN